MLFLGLGRDGGAALGVDASLDDGFALADPFDRHLDHRIADTDPRFEQAQRALAQVFGKRVVRGSVAIGGDKAGGRIDHGDITCVQPRHRRGDQPAQSPGLGGFERGTRHRDRDRGRGVQVTRKGPVAGVREMDARRANARHGEDGAGQLPLLRTPVGSVEHLRCGTESRE